MTHLGNEYLSMNKAIKMSILACLILKNYIILSIGKW